MNKELIQEQVNNLQDLLQKSLTKKDTSFKFKLEFEENLKKRIVELEKVLEEA